jgi:hypothetical protein
VHNPSHGPDVQTLPEHVLPGSQTVPQPPQLFESLLVSTQVPLQSVVPLGQPQAVPRHFIPFVQLVVQSPQCESLLITLMQLAPHSISPGFGQSVQPPSVHFCAAVQAIAQSPQCVGSVCRSTQLPPQSLRPDVHWHCPVVHTEFRPHTVLQLPQ